MEQEHRRRVVSLWLPNFATDRLTRLLTKSQTESRPKAQSEPSPAPVAPLATVMAAHGGVRIVAVSPAARAGGVFAGQPLADARAVLTGLCTLDADPQADARAIEGLAAWCGRYTPWTVVDKVSCVPGDAGVWLDITGCAHLFGGEEALLGDLLSRMERVGYAARAALADTPGAAWAVARFGQTDERSIAVVPGNAHRRTLAPLPMAGLRLDAATVEGLARVGLRRIGDILDLPRAPLAARFGDALIRRLDQALGIRGETLSPRVPVPLLSARLPFAEPISRAEDIAAAIRHLVDDLCVRLEASRQGARRLNLVLYRTDGTRTGVGVGTSLAARDADHLERLFREKIERLDPGFGIELMTLCVPAADDLGPVQVGLDALNVQEGISHKAHEDLARLVDRVGNRLGPANVSRLVAQASHIPEKACREIPALAPAPDIHDGPHRSVQPRPLHLLACPSPIEVMAPVPDHPPVMFRWGRTQHRIVRADGPERIGPEWWLEDQPHDAASHERKSRDYFRVEDTDGRRFWVYREGLYKPGLPPRWYLHGEFA